MRPLPSLEKLAWPALLAGLITLAAAAFLGAWFGAARGVTALYLVQPALRKDLEPLKPIHQGRDGLLPGLRLAPRQGLTLESPRLPELPAPLPRRGELDPLPGPAPFLLEWRGYLEAPLAGRYAFHLTTAHRGFLLLDGVQVAGHLGNGHITEAVSHEIRLEPGLHTFQLILQVPEAATSPTLRLEWTVPGTAKTSIPAEAFYHPPPDDPAREAAWLRESRAPMLPAELTPALEHAVLHTAHFPGIRFFRAHALKTPYLEAWPYDRAAFPGHFYGYELYFRGLYKAARGEKLQLRLDGQGTAQLYFDGKPLFEDPTKGSRLSPPLDLTLGVHPFSVTWQSPLPTGKFALYGGPPGGRLELLGADKLRLRPTDAAARTGAPMRFGLLAALGAIVAALGARALRRSGRLHLDDLKESIYDLRLPLGVAALLLLGGALRLHEAELIPPHGETMDELANAWNGWHLVRGEGPKTWADKRFHAAYPDRTRYLWFDNPYTVVAPYVDRPPLFPLLVGLTTAWTAPDRFFQMPLGTIRFLPIVLSMLTLPLVIGLGRRLYGEAIGWLAGGLYALAPLIVWSNRLAKEESLLTFCFTLGVYAALRGVGHTPTDDRERTIRGADGPLTDGSEERLEGSRGWWWLSMLAAALAPWCKEIGITAIPIIGWIWWRAGGRRQAVRLAIAAFLIAALYPVYGMLVAGDLFWTIVRLQGSKDTAFDLGLRFLTEGRTASEPLLLGDGFMLWLWLAALSTARHRERLPHLAAGLYLAFIVALAWSDGLFGWYRLPLYPFLCVTGGLALVELWKEPGLLRALALLYCLPWAMMAQLELAGLTASRAGLRGMTALALILFLPATMGAGGWTLRAARAGLVMIGLLSAGLALAVVVYQVAVY